MHFKRSVCIRQGLLEAIKKGELKGTNEDVEEHLHCTYGGFKAADSLRKFAGKRCPKEPGHVFFYIGV